jgi:hypothetical protein
MHAGIDTRSLRELLASKNLRRLNWLAIHEGGYGGAPALDFSPDLAAALSQLPQLAGLSLGVKRCDPRVRQVLHMSAAPAWVLLNCQDDYSIQTHRASLAPERWPPLDNVLEQWYSDYIW